jgi:hypothetical protein
VSKHLDDILFEFESGDSQKTTSFLKIRIFYYGTPINIEFNKEANNAIEMGSVASKGWQEHHLWAQPIPVFRLSIKYWINKGLTLSYHIQCF